MYVRIDRNTEEFVFLGGIKPTPPEGRYPSHTSIGTTHREVLQREYPGLGLLWVVRWTRIPNTMREVICHAASMNGPCEHELLRSHVIAA